MSSELSREPTRQEIEQSAHLQRGRADFETGDVTLPVQLYVHLCDMALAHLDSKEAGRVSVPREPTREMLNAAIDVHGHKLCEISALGFRKSPQWMFEQSYRAMLSAAPAPADQVKHDDAGGRQE